jgi:DNA-binding protein HU-beta
MNKCDMIEALSRDTGLSKQKSAQSIESVMRSISLALKRGDDITLSGFGTFSVYQRKARNGRNPQTGELIKIKTRRVAKFSAGSDLRKALVRG